MNHEGHEDHEAILERDHPLLLRVLRVLRG